jgi:16S rRNA G966 N2-methylase RsmD
MRRETLDKRQEGRDSSLQSRVSSLRSHVSSLKSPKYQVFFRVSRGGCGIEYEAAKAEFLSVVGRRETGDVRHETSDMRQEGRDSSLRSQVSGLPKVQMIREIPSRMRMEVSIDGLSTDEIASLAENLGYTQGITSVREEPYRGEELHSRKTGRWVVGWLRKGDKKLHLTEIYRQDENKRLEESPDKRVFLIERDGEVKPAKGHRYRRGVSSVDTRFMVNIAELRGDEIILDSFAGIGGILIECRRRNLRIFAADVDPVLRPGLAQFSDNRSAIADARQLPFKNNTFDVIITEPPFGTRYRQTVLDSMAELRRVVREKIILLIAQDMYEGIMECMAGSGFHLMRDFALRRHSKLVSHVLRFDWRVRESD